MQRDGRRRRGRAGKSLRLARRSEVWGGHVLRAALTGSGTELEQQTGWTMLASALLDLRRWRQEWLSAHVKNYRPPSE